LEGKLKSLPLELRQVVMDFIEFQRQKVQKKKYKKGNLLLAGFGALEDYRTEFTSLKPQGKRLEWRG